MFNWFRKTPTITKTITIANKDGSNVEITLRGNNVHYVNFIKGRIESLFGKDTDTPQVNSKPFQDFDKIFEEFDNLMKNTFKK